MLILAVDTTTQAGSLAALRGDRVLGVIASRDDEPYSSRLFRQVDLLLKDLSLELSQFELFAVAAGPGSFTGLRVGLTAVKGWAEVYARKVAAVSSLEAVAAQARALSPLLAPVIDARRGQVFGGLYERAGQALRRRCDDAVMAPGEFFEFIQREAKEPPVVFVSPTPEVLRPLLEQSALPGWEIETVSGVLAPAIGRLGYARAQRGELVDALSLDAHYVRRSDAELHWKGPA